MAIKRLRRLADMERCVRRDQYEAVFREDYAAMRAACEDAIHNNDAPVEAVIMWLFEFVSEFTVTYQIPRSFTIELLSHYSEWAEAQKEAGTWDENLLLFECEMASDREAAIDF